VRAFREWHYHRHVYFATENLALRSRMSAIGFCLHSPSELDQLREAYGSLNDVERNLAGAIEPIN
jgi:hypothetical protein